MIFQGHPSELNERLFESTKDVVVMPDIGRCTSSNLNSFTHSLVPILTDNFSFLTFVQKKMKKSNVPEDNEV